MEIVGLIAGTKWHQVSFKMRRLLCGIVICIAAFGFVACGGNSSTGTGTNGNSASTGKTSSEGGTAYTPEKVAAYTSVLSPYLRKNHPNLYFSKSGGSSTVREGEVWVLMPFAGKDSVLETCNAVAAFAASSEAPFAVPNVMVEAGPEPGSGSIKASITARGAAGGKCTIQ